MGAETGYGTQVEVLGGLLEAFGDAAVVLSYEEDRTFAALSLNRFDAVGSCRQPSVRKAPRRPVILPFGVRGAGRSLAGSSR